MQQYQSYLNPQTQAVQPMYPTYNFQNQMQSPYIDRYAQNQAMQQMNQMQNQQVQQVQGLNGRIVDDFGMITANDVPMDAMGALFIKSDGTEIQRRVWTSNGTIATSRFKPVLEEQSNNLPQGEEKAAFDLSEASTEALMKRFDDITERLDKMEKNFGKAATTRSKREVEAE